MVSTAPVMNDVNTIYLFQAMASTLFGYSNKLENFKDRLSALEAKVTNEGLVLSDTQITALERKHKVRWPAVKLKRLMPAT